MRKKLKALSKPEKAFLLGAVLLVALVTLSYTGLALADQDPAKVLTVDNPNVSCESPVAGPKVEGELGRTIIVSGTALLTALALFFFGGEVLHGFAFTMVIGIITGTYSSVFIAAAIVSFWRGKGPTRAAAHAPATVTTAPQQPQRRTKPQRKARAS